jgi:hypothetical protein
LAQTRSTSKTILAKPDSRFPFVSYYEAKATYIDRSATPPEIVEAVTELKWFRLFKDGTYQTNKVKNKEQRGRYVFNSKCKEIIFKDGWLRTYSEYRPASVGKGSGERPFPFITWLGPGECVTHCDWKPH